MIVRAALLASLVLCAPPVSAQDVGEVAARVHREGGYAGQLPIEPGANRPATTFGDGDGASAGRGPGERRRAPSSFALPFASPLLGYLLVALAIGAVAALLIAVLARTRGTEAFAPAPARAPSLPPRSPFAHLDVDADPDALAREGRYAEAITAALLRGLRAVGWKPDGEQNSRTAREIVASVDASDARRSTLAELLGIEERVAFGGDEPTRERWDEARERWLQLDRGGPT